MYRYPYESSRPNASHIFIDLTPLGLLSMVTPEVTCLSLLKSRMVCGLLQESVRGFAKILCYRFQTLLLVSYGHHSKYSCCTAVTNQSGNKDQDFDSQ